LLPSSRESAWSLRAEREEDDSMVRARFMFAALAMLITGIAQAADYHPPPPAPPPYIPPPPQDCCAAIENWYLRGFVGVGINAKYKLDVTQFPDTYIATNSIADSYFIGGGVGYNWNNWLRLDVTGEYRAKTRITALSVSQPGGSGPVALDQYEGNLSSWVFLANAFVDLGTWDCFTPFVGAGIGFAYNKISDFYDVTPNVIAFGGDGSSFGLGQGTSNWSFAWALYAGVSYAVSKNFNIDLTYRYLNFGTAKETVICAQAGGCVDLTFKDLHSNDIMLGLRWTCCDTAPPRYVYQPQPYMPPPPPLQSRG
jgi:opacity protein-like surface antigen